MMGSSRVVVVFRLVVVWSSVCWVVVVCLGLVCRRWC